MTYTFNDKDNLFTFVVKKEFLEKCPNPDQQDLESLVVNFDFKNFLHNPNGHAVTYLTKIPDQVREALLKNESVGMLDGKVVTYWLNGELMTGENLKKLKHDAGFSDKFDAMLSK